MRISPDQLAEHLKRRLLPIYLLSGTETFLLEESASLIRQALIAPDVEHKRFQESSQVWEQLQSEIQHVSLFSSRQLIELRLSKLAANDAKQLQQLLESAHQDVSFLLIAEQLSKQQQQGAWFKLVEERGAVITHWPLVGPAFTKWVAHRSKQRNVNLSDEECRLLAYQTEGNCLAASQEIEQLYWFRQDGETRANTQFDQQSQFTVFDLCEAALQHQPARVIKIVSCLKENEGSPAQLIVWALGQMLRALLRASFVSQDGERRQILTAAGIRSTTQMLYLKLLKAPEPKRWMKLLSILSAADREFKSGQNASFWQSILKITVNLSKSYTHNPAFCI
jgi:DNA polymerase-3 subunit delta